MSDQLLDILKYALLALLYLFFARVLWAVWSEVRTPTAQSAGRPVGPGAGRAAAVGTPPAQAHRDKPPKGRRGDVARLTVIEPKARRGQRHSIAEELTIGRAPGCSLSLADDTFASQIHARVYRSDGSAWVDDLGSTNGTYVNGNRIRQATRLHPGDRVQVGGTVLEAG